MKLLEYFFSPIMFSIGFLTPLIGQVLLAFNIVSEQPLAYGIGFTVSMVFGLVAQFRGSWLWIRS